MMYGLRSPSYAVNYFIVFSLVWSSHRSIFLSIVSIYGGPMEGVLFKVLLMVPCVWVVEHLFIVVIYEFWGCSVSTDLCCCLCFMVCIITFQTYQSFYDVVEI